jgi:hypothetical protein
MTATLEPTGGMGTSQATRARPCGSEYQPEPGRRPKLRSSYNRSNGFDRPVAGIRFSRSVLFGAEIART